MNILSTINNYEYKNDPVKCAKYAPYTDELEKIVSSADFQESSLAIFFELIKYNYIDLFNKIYELVEFDIDSADNFGFTLLMVAVMNSRSNSTEFVSLLLRLNANVNARTIDGVTALILCARHYLPDAAILLVGVHADIEIKKNNRNYNALMMAVYYCAQMNPHETAPHIINRMIKLLIERGADLAEVNVFGDTPLMIAMQQFVYNDEHMIPIIDTINYLLYKYLEKPELLDIKNISGYTALDIATATLNKINTDTVTTVDTKIVEAVDDKSTDATAVAGSTIETEHHPESNIIENKKSKVKVIYVDVPYVITPAHKEKLIEYYSRFIEHLKNKK